MPCDDDFLHFGCAFVDAKCADIAIKPFDDVTAASSQYSLALNAASRRVGWDHITVFAPEDWLAASDIVTDAMRP